MSHASREAIHPFISIAMFNTWGGAPGIYR